MFFMEIEKVIVICISPTELLEIRIPIFWEWTGVKMEVQRFAHECGLEIFFLYQEINNLEIKYWVKKMLVARYSRALIA